MTITTPSELISDRRLSILSIVLLLGAMTSILDTTIVNVALDQFHTIFRASVADTQWVSSGYLLALAGVIPLTGWAVERFGARTIWMSAVALFLLGSILCGFAWDLPSLIGFRVLQGIGGGMILPVTMTILTQAAGPARLGKAMATIALPAQLAPILGPIIGGALIDSVGWNWLFFVNVPLCIVALVFAPRFLPADERDRAHRLDIRGFLLLTPAMIALAYGISESGSSEAFAALSSWLPLTIGALLMVCFAIYSLRTRRTPLVDVRVFGRRSFGLASVIVFVGGFSNFAAVYLLPQFYQIVRGESPFTTGLLLIPQGLGTIAFILLQRRIGSSIDVRIVVATGIVLSVIGLLPFTMIGATGGEPLLLLGQFVRGFGVGASTLPIMTIAFASLNRSEIPRASSAFSIVQRVGSPFGVTVVAVILQALLTATTATAGGAGAGVASPVTGAFAATFWWVILFSAVPLVLAFLLPSLKKTSSEAEQRAEQTAVAAAEA
jgi:EmrB/QacA subfamily drug resistance transporter